MHYTNEFRELVLKSDLENHNDYIGKGNPNAKILIIGKELALDQNQIIEIKETLNRNVSDWKNNIDNPNKEIVNWNKDFNLFNPMFPYKGMMKKEQSFGQTWRKYQLLHDKLFSSELKSYDFYNKIFITELNSNPSKYSNDQNKENDERKKSINERVNNFFKSDFIQNFPIIIVATGHYTRDYNVNLCKLFNIDFKSPTKEIKGEKIVQWYNVHQNKPTQKPKLLIHTKQLSMVVLDELLEQIANEIKCFSKENDIHL
jgi:hypothetical protein